MDGAGGAWRSCVRDDDATAFGRLGRDALWVALSPDTDIACARAGCLSTTCAVLEASDFSKKGLRFESLARFGPAGKQAPKRPGIGIVVDLDAHRITTSRDIYGFPLGGPAETKPLPL